MCSTALENRGRATLRLGIGLAAIGAVATLVYIARFEPTAALPDPLEETSRFENMEARIGSAEALRDTIGYLATLAIALAAIVGFLIKDGFGKIPLQAAGNLVLLTIFSFFLARTFLLAFDGYNMIAIQLREGLLYVSLINDIIFIQAGSLVFATAIAALLTNIKLG